eukprot:NODE_8677_length_657_cov_23.528090_g8052_i0.p1 GENE.NODE_8677_length_657_cov_23.528090_g8052_i0~~NODE_8677_length_657_cov_23.528090_g8052_i0.p1  ORF type:complete len:176 (-),score=14.60 NODE_8677_length_657_cov_23.528090_g8052_i0:78-605(-)
MGVVSRYLESSEWSPLTVTIYNILWLLTGGLLQSIGLYLCGAIFFISLIGTPLSYAFFELGRSVVWPFGKKLKPGPTSSTKKWLNTAWIMTVGIFYAYSNLFTALGLSFGWIIVPVLKALNSEPEPSILPVPVQVVLLLIVAFFLLPVSYMMIHLIPLYLMPFSYNLENEEKKRN